MSGPESARARVPPALPVGLPEASLALLLAVAVALCLSLGEGFRLGGVLHAYFLYFGGSVIAAITLSRLSLAARERWRPAGDLGRRVRGWLGGEPRPGDILPSDLELLRGLLVLLVSLGVYTNVKVRLPIINRAVGDVFFLAIDQAVLGERLIPWIERTVAASPLATALLTRVYFHGYVWMVLLVILLYLRQDRAGLRWAFLSVCFVYLLGILGAAALPSYGPFFFEPQRFGWLEGTLTGTVQRNLTYHLFLCLELVRNGRSVEILPFGGVAAFPSLHIAHMVVLMVVAWRGFRWFSWVMAVVATLTTLATVAFGWHYLVDAVGGAALAVGVTLGLRRLIYGRRGSPPVQERP